MLFSVFVNDVFVKLGQIEHMMELARISRIIIFISLHAFARLLGIDHPYAN